MVRTRLELSETEDLMPFRALLVAAALAASSSITAAQTLIRPEPAPARVAGNEAWYRAGEPVVYRGEAFHPAGAQVFFNPNVMVLAGEFRGVPVYIDPTLEPGSIVYIPISAGVMQPYEKLRAGGLAGTSGSRTPSFPPAPATSLEPQPVATVLVTPPAPPPGEPAVAAGAVSRTPVAPRTITIAPSTAPRGRGIWISWNGQQWRTAGAAVRVGPQMIAIGTYNGRTVYRAASGDTIWIETAQGLATPWRRR
jgi:hypothetical protein